jgi:hypothetical protein
MECDWFSGSRQKQDSQSFRMRFLLFCSIEIEEVKKTPQYFWSHLNDLQKVSALKLFQSRLWRDVTG